MTDNVTANSGSGGATFATDDVAGVHYPVSKLAHGALDSATLVTTTSGLPVQQQGVWTVQPGNTANTTAWKVDGSAVTQPVSGTVTANAGSGTFTVDSELPAAAALADAAANPTTPTAGSASLLFNGTTWDRVRGDTTNGIDVDVTRLPALVASTANIGDVDVLTLPAIPTGTNSIGRVNPEPQTANGLSISRTLSAASTNATSVKASAGQVYTVYAHNINAAVRFLKLYNKASAPTVGTDTPVLTLPIPGNTAGAGFTLDTGGMGIAFATGIALALTTGLADSDTGAVAANEIVINLLFK